LGGPVRRAGTLECSNRESHSGAYDGGPAHDMTDGIAYAAIIPAYRPGAQLLYLVRALVARAVPAIVLVDDGSGAAHGIGSRRPPRSPVSPGSARGQPRQGRGAQKRHTVRTGYVSRNDGRGDGGCRWPARRRGHRAHRGHSDGGAGRTGFGRADLFGEVPWRSRFGNLLTRSVLRAAIGSKLADTQTGLRGVPRALAARLPPSKPTVTSSSWKC